MNRKSLSYNAILNCIKTISAIVFPLITLPYINRVLLVDNIGKINFSTSIVNYFIQLAGLGIANYAIREGSKFRDDRDKLNNFCNQVFTINILATFVSYILLVIILWLTPGFHSYALLIFLQSINIIGTTVGISWFYSVIEDYTYITVRTLVFQVISLILMLTFVKTPNDIYVYAIILVISTSGSSLMNYIHARKFISLHLTKMVEWKKHMPPIITLFATSMAMVIYVNLDTTMIGLMVGDYYNGIYSVSVKVYTILKYVLASVLVVTLPRLSYYVFNNMLQEYRTVLKKSFSSILILILPIITGINLLCKEVILIVAGDSYITASTSLHILSVAIFFSLIATYFSNSILLPLKKEKIVLKATIIGAAVNLGLNFIFIYTLQERGAAITTLIAEVLVVLIELPYSKKYIQLNYGTILKSVIGCICITVFCLILRNFNLPMSLYTIFAIFGSAIGYFTILLILRTDELIELLNKFKFLRKG